MQLGVLVKNPKIYYMTTGRVGNEFQAFGKETSIIEGQRQYRMVMEISKGTSKVRTTVKAHFQ